MQQMSEAALSHDISLIWCLISSWTKDGPHYLYSNTLLIKCKPELLGKWVTSCGEMLPPSTTLSSVSSHQPHFFHKRLSEE